MGYFCHFQEFDKNRKFNFDSSKSGYEIWVTYSFSEQNFSLFRGDELATSCEYKFVCLQYLNKNMQKIAGQLEKLTRKVHFILANQSNLCLVC